jgi:monofunctional biosynthetic peptidoglycan transglycosylase
MFFNKFWLQIILLCSMTMASFGVTALHFYQEANLEILFTTYPKWSASKKDFILDDSKPREWVTLDQVSKYAKWAILVSEDWAFYEHQGLDFNQIERALKQSLVEFRLVRGASTISQQVVKNLFVGDERSLWRKFKEALFTLKLENHFSKDEILEIYLNIAHLGKNIYGIKEASFHYFKKHPSMLTAKEGAFIAMLLPSPEKYSHSFRKKELTPFAKSQIEDILIKLRQANVYKEEDRLKARKQVFSWEKREVLEPMDSPRDEYYDAYQL